MKIVASIIVLMVSVKTGEVQIDWMTLWYNVIPKIFPT